MAKGGATYDTLRSALSKGDFSPVYLFYGEEDFLIEEAAESVIEAALTEGERGFNLEILYGAEADPRDVVSHASSFPMMAERRVVVLREADKISQGEILASYIENPSPTTCLILTCTKPDMRRKPFVTVKKGGMAIEFKPMWENQVVSWVGARAKKSKRSLNSDAASLLVAYAGTSLRELNNELEKLYIYVGEKSSITTDDVSAVVGLSKEFTVFDLQWAIAGKDPGKATHILERMLQAGEQPIVMVAVLTKFFQTLGRVHDAKRRGANGGQALSQAGVYSFIERYEQALSRFSFREVENAFLLLSEVDEKLKSTAIDPKLLMQAFIVSVSASRAA